MIERVTYHPWTVIIAQGYKLSVEHYQLTPCSQIVPGYITRYSSSQRMRQDFVMTAITKHLYVKVVPPITLITPGRMEPIHYMLLFTCIVYRIFMMMFVSHHLQTTNGSIKYLIVTHKIRFKHANLAVRPYANMSETVIQLQALIRVWVLNSECTLNPVY